MALTELDLCLPSAAGVATYPPGATYGPRTMRDFEFVWMIEGDAEYTLGDVTVAAPRGSVVLCRPGSRDFFRWDPKRRTRHGYYHFEVRRHPADWPPPDRWPLVRLPGDGDVLRPLFRHLLTWAGTGGNPALTRLTMAHMLTSYVTGQHDAGDVPHDALPEAVDRAWAYLHDRLERDPAAPISLGDLADIACVTPEHLCRLFSASVGHSPVETVRLARLDRAATLLARSNYSVKEVAQMCGFSSPFHFSRVFKDAFGQSPRQFRTAIEAGVAPPLSRLLRHVRRVR